MFEKELSLNFTKHTEKLKELNKHTFPICLNFLTLAPEGKKSGNNSGLGDLINSGPTTKRFFNNRP